MDVKGIQLKKLEIKAKKNKKFAISRILIENA